MIASDSTVSYLKWALKAITEHADKGYPTLTPALALSLPSAKPLTLTCDLSADSPWARTLTLTLTLTLT